MAQQHSFTRAELEECNIVPLTMALIQSSGDLSLLDDIAPHVRGAWDHMESVPRDLADRLRHRMLEELRRLDEGGLPRLNAPDDALLLRMMSVAVGENVPSEYLPMLREHMGLSEDPATPAVQPSPPTQSDFRVAIVGAGASGLCAAIRLGQAGIPYTVFEKNAEVGGTWHENRYPGCAVDTPNHFYQFSFEPNNDWPNYFSYQPSILEYLRGCADKYGVIQHTCFGHEVVSAIYDSARDGWDVTTRDPAGQTHSEHFKLVISAVGQLNRPAIPKISGLESFAGVTMHTAAWLDEVELTGKRVALIGTGASAVQVGPGIVDRVAQLSVLQRSGSWVVRRPNIDRTVSEGMKSALHHIPGYASWYRFQLFWAFGDGLFEALRIDPDWQGGGESISALNARYREAMVRHMQRELADREDLLEKVIPDYPPFGKRVLADAGWYKMLKREHVELVTEAIASVEPQGLRLADGRLIEVDVIIFATGFQAERMLWPMDIRGRSGTSIRERWGDNDPRAFLGITVPDFPNLFLMYGPNTNLGHGGSAIFLAECQVRYTLKLIEAMRTQGLSSVEIRRSAHDEYNRTLDAELKTLSWSHPSVSTWYKNANGRITTNQPWRLIDYWRLTYQPDLNDYLTA